MSSLDDLGPVRATPGVPLYVAVREKMLEAIRSGAFQPGDRLPSTKEMSRKLAVSLVTTHRALQELETFGVIDRMQGRGTFISDRTNGAGRDLRIGLLMQPDASLADYYHGQVLEGMHRAAREKRCEITIIQRFDRSRPNCRAFVLVNPMNEQIHELEPIEEVDAPVLLVGARSKEHPWIDVNNRDLVAEALAHLHRLGHRRILFLGGADELSNSRDRVEGFREACAALDIQVPEEDGAILARGWRLEHDERMALGRLLSSAERPTAVLAAGYYLALDVYQAAAVLGLRVPDDLSVIGFDDPPSAEHLDPPLSTLRQPLIQLGYAAVDAAVDLIVDPESAPRSQALQGNLVIRQSSGSAPT
ncbi:MAG: GntR family transcriptional regulator [Planctomycetota bacterium]